jgi:hypothetical protein
MRNGEARLAAVDRAANNYAADVTAAQVREYRQTH